MPSEKILTDLEVDGKILATTIPNNTGTLLTVSDIDNKTISTRTNAQIINDLLLTGYVVGSNTAISNGNSILSAFQNIQAQILNIKSFTYVNSFNSRSGNVFPQLGDYSTSLVAEGSNLYYTESRVNANANVAANTAARHNALTLGTVNGLSLVSQVLSLGLSSSATTGALSSSDWNIFNSKQAAGSYATLTGVETLTNKSISGGQITSAVANATLATNSSQWGTLVSNWTSGIQSGGVTSLLGVHSNGTSYGFNASAIQSFLGLGSNAYNSTAYLPLTGGALTGALTGTSASFSSKLAAQGEIVKYTTSGYDGVFDNLLKYGTSSDLNGVNSSRWIGIDATITAGAAVTNALRIRAYAGGTSNAAPVNVADFRGDQSTMLYGAVTTVGQTIIANAFRFYSGGNDGSTAYGDFRTNPASGNSIISAKTNALYFNYDHGTGGVIFCDGAAGVVATINSAGIANFNGSVTAPTFIGALNGNANSATNSTALGGQTYQAGLLDTGYSISGILVSLGTNIYRMQQGGIREFLGLGSAAYTASTAYIPRNNTGGTPVAAYYLTGGSTTRIKVKLPFVIANVNNMVSFTVRIYQSYVPYDIQISGYLYSSVNQWYAPKAIMIAGGGQMDVIFGRDTDGKAYVSFSGGQYTGVGIFDVTSGFVAGDWNTGWSIADDSTVPNQAETIITSPTINTGNYSSYSPTLTGAGANGTWGINISGNAATATNLSNTQSNWNSVGGLGNVVGMLSWKNYGNGHVIFDASNSTSPSGTAVSNSTPQSLWSPSFPTLMGWNGGSTYGVRVDSSRLADSATNWGGFQGDFNSVSTSFDYMVVRDSGAGRVKLGDSTAVRSWLGLGSAAYLNASQSSIANNIVQRDGNGYINTSYIYYATAVDDGSPLEQFAGFGGSYLRKYSIGATKSALGLGSSAYVNETLGSILAKGETTGGYRIRATGGSGTNYTTSNIELLGSGRAPNISFHYAGVVASNITIESSGRIAIMNNPGTGYENFIAKDITATGVLIGASATFSAQLNAQQGRFAGWYTGGSSHAVEIGVSGSDGVVISYDRTTSLYKPLFIQGATITFAGPSTFQSSIYVTGDSRTIYGPNSTWGASLSIGGNGNNASTLRASIAATDGNIHLDPANGSSSTYLNFYSGAGGVIFGNGGQSTVASINSLGTFTGTSVIAPNIYTSGGWYYSQGGTGWYNNTYGGGIYMSDSSWVRVYNGKGFLVDSTVVATNFKANSIYGFNVADYGIGLVGNYAANRYQAVFSMGGSYVPAVDGTSLSNMYGIAWTHENVGGQSKVGLGHQALFVAAGVTQTAIGIGVWTAGRVTAGTGTDGGFQNDSYSAGHNNIWRLSNAAEYGIGYYQGGTDHIGFHFGARATAKHKFYATGNATFDGYVTATGGGGTSDMRHKNLVDTNLDLSWLDTDRSISFNWKNGLDSKTHYGYSAQEVYTWCKDLVFTDNPEKLALNQVELLVLEVKRLKQRVSQLENLAL